MKARLVAGIFLTGMAGVVGYQLLSSEEVAVASYTQHGRGYVRLGEILPTTLAWYGDSITQGSCNPTPPPAKLLAGLPGYYVVNRGISAERMIQITARYFANAATDCLGERCGVNVFAGGTNDFGLGTGDVAEVLALQRAAVDDSLTRGRRTIVLDVPPFLVPPGCIGCIGGNEAGVAKAMEYNAALAEACARPERPNKQLLRCVATYTTMEAPGPVRGYLKDELHCDGTDYVHTSQAGADELARLVGEALASF